MSVDSDGPRLLNKLEYLNLLSANAVPSSCESEAERILDYARAVWTSLELKPRKMRTTDIVGCYKHGQRLAFHIRAFPRKRPETNVVVFFEPKSSEFFGHILIDLAAEYSDPRLDCPSGDYDDIPKPEDLKSLLALIRPDDDNPFAIFGTGDGTYIQTLCTDEGYIVEYQLVNTSSHYETTNAVSLAEVVASFQSYGFGENEWLESFEWQRQDLG